MIQHRVQAPRRVLTAFTLVVGGLAASGCLTGERPSFEDQDTAPIVSTGNADIDEVLGLLDSVDRSEFTAGYDIDTKFNTVESTATVVIDVGNRLSVTVTNDARSIRFIDDGEEELTCDLIEGECETSLNDARISDTQLSHEFYGPSFAARLRADADRRIADPEAYTTAVAGQEAQCVDVSVSGGTKVYCALLTGPLARFEGADVTIELTSYDPQPDPTQFETS